MNQDKRSVTWEEIEKARKRLGMETGAVVKDWGGKYPFAFVYPNSYYIGMSSLGMQVIYDLLNGYPDIVCERLFWDKENQEKGSMPLSVESQRPLTDYAVLGFSLSYEIDYLNIVPILKTSGIPPLSRDRDETYPLIIAGGPCISSNPMPVAPFFDCLCIGEAEVILPRLMEMIKDNPARNRPSLLEAISEIPGIYVPSLHKDKAIVRQYLKKLDEFPAHSVVLTPDTELPDMYLVEVERGCAHACRFCMVSNTFKPMRFRSLESLISQAEEGLKLTRRIGLVGPAVTDHPEFEELLAYLVDKNARVSVSSLRINRLSDKILDDLVKGGLHSIALAPEAGSQRMRDVIKKGINEDQIFKAVSNSAARGMQQLKLYYMIGLPGETEEDIGEIVKLTLAAKEIVDKKRKKTRLVINVSPFIPKADTEFERFPTASIEELQRRIGLLKSGLSHKGVQIKNESPIWSQIQAVISRGDTSLADVLLDIEKPTLKEWKNAIEKHRIDVEYFAHTEWKPEAALPWGFVKSDC